MRENDGSTVGSRGSKEVSIAMKIEGYDIDRKRRMGRDQLVEVSTK